MLVFAQASGIYQLHEIRIFWSLLFIGQTLHEFPLFVLFFQNDYVSGQIVWEASLDKYLHLESSFRR